MRAALLYDYPEEQWQSMDLCAQMLLEQWQTDRRWQLHRVCPSFQHRLTRLPKLGRRRVAFNSDRLFNRFWDYPRHVQKIATQFDVFHICDHTYAHLIHELPAHRTGVYCHDIDAFRSLLEPTQEPRPQWYRKISQRILDGFQQAALVFYSTDTVRQQLGHYRLIDPTRLVQAPLGVAPEFCAAPIAPAQRLEDPPFLLHVGSCIPRKRVDVLLTIFAQLKLHHPNLRLIKVSGTWTPEHEQQIAQLGIGSAIAHLHDLSRSAIADLYRRAAVVLLTSEAEGFGLPLIESLACGAIAIASDLPVLREVAGDAALYCPVGEIAAWVETVDRVLKDSSQAPARSLRLARASQYSWKTHTETISQAYLGLGIQPVAAMR